MGFAAGFNGGYAAASEGLEARRKRKMESELATQGEEYDTVRGTGLRVTDRQTGEESSVVIDPSSGADMNAIREQYMNAGYMVDTMDDAYGARSGQGADNGGAYRSEVEAQSAARKGNYGLANKRASIYEKYGDTEGARGIRRDAQSMRLQDQEMDLAVSADKRAQAGETRAQQEYDWLQGERTKLAGMEAAMKAYTAGDWATLGDLATNVWGDKYQYDIDPDGMAVTVVDKETGKPLQTLPMPSQEQFTDMLLKSDSKNWLPLQQRDTQREQWMYEYNADRMDARDRREYQQGALENDRIRTSAAVQQARMGTPIETTEGIYTPVMVDGRMTYEPAIGSDGTPLRKPQKPIDDKVLMEVQAEAQARAQANPAFKKATPALRQQMVQEETNAILQNLRPQPGGQGPAIDDDAGFANADRIVAARKAAVAESNGPRPVGMGAQGAQSRFLRDTSSPEAEAERARLAAERAATTRAQGLRRMNGVPGGSGSLVDDAAYFSNYHR